MAKNIVIIGAGFAGIATARKLGKKFKKDESVNITLIDKHSYLTYMTELHEVAGGRVEPSAIKYDLQRLLHGLKNIHLVTDTVTEINHDRQEVITEHGSYSFDYLVVSAGGEANDFGVSGVKENSFTLWSVEAAERVREHIIDCVYAAAREHDEAKRRALLSFVVCGAGFTGVEMIGELTEWLPELAKEHKLNLDEVSYHLVEAAPNILNTVTDIERDRAKAYMTKQGIEISLSDGIVNVEKDHIELKSGKVIPSYTTIWTAGVKANSEASSWGFEYGRAGRILTDEHLKAKGYDNVYVAGDIAYYEDPSQDNRPIPQIVQAAEQTGALAAENIIAEINGENLGSYQGKYDGNMVSIGSRYSVSLLYDKYHLHGFWSNLVKHAANVKYFLSIFSFYYAWTYVRHEFFEIKGKKNMFGGHLSAHGNMLWLVPLRIFYGCMWLFEGLKKCFGMFGGESWFGDTMAFPFEWLQEEVVSAASAAEDTADAATEAVNEVFSLNYAFGEDPMLVIKDMPDWFASIMKFMMPNRDVAFFMQKFMSVLEVAIGLALIVGLFTWLVSAGTVAMVAMFCLSGMFYWVNMWFVPVAIALMAGAGKTFGLDYYVMPWLGRLLDRWIWGQPKHLYQEV